MSLQEQVDQAWKDAMKARDPKKDALSLIRTELKNRAIADRKGGDQSTVVTDEVAVEVLSKMAKQRRDSIEQFQNGGRQDLVEKEQAELDVIDGFLPQQLTEAELSAIVDEVVESTGAQSMKEMGKVMGAIMPKVKGRADGKAIQALVKARLGAAG
jgi:uncharacterized protein YqeY